MENHIKNTLNSLVNQSFQNFEVIIINDGSTDKTQEIIDEYANKYSNFKCIYQKNQGVAFARNTGLKIAEGDYIGFLDPDGDIFNINALKNFNDTITKYNNPDLVIGRQTKIDPWGTHHYVNAKLLSNSDTIEPHNKWLIWTMSLMNKMFSRKKLLENGLKMPLLSYASDGAFVLPFAYSCDNIAGCPHEIISYNKRVFSDGYSISQTSNIKTFDDYCNVHNIIYDSFIEYSKKYMSKNSDDELKLNKFKNAYLVYLDALLHRQCSILISQFYRFFWRTDIQVIEKIKETINNYKEEMLPTSWEKLQNSNKDLNIENLITDKKEMVKNPIVTIAISPSIKKDSFNKILNNIHNFHFPSFEIFISEDSNKKLLNFFINKEYIKFIKCSSELEFKNNILNKSNGKFLLYLDKDVFMSPDLLKKMFDKIYNSKFDFIVSKIKPFIVSDSSNNSEINDYFKIDYIKKNKKFYNTFSNILININFIKENNFLFTENVYDDIIKLQNMGNFTYYKKLPIIINDKYIEDPSISLIIDDMEITDEQLNNLFESIYTQDFESFDVILNEKLKSKVKHKFLKKSNLSIINLKKNYSNKNNNFKKLAIEKSKSKYGFFINIPIVVGSNSLKNLFSDIEEKQQNVKKSDKNRYAFTSSPFYYFNDNDGDKKLIKIFSSNLLAYTYKDLNYSSYKSRFMIFDLYLSNKLFNLDILKENNIYFENSYEDVLNLYKNFKFSKINQKSILTSLNQKNLFKSGFGNRKIPFLINFQYYVHKFIFSIIILRRNLKNIAN